MYKIKKQKHPPKSKRFCKVCKRETIWKYDPNVFHSCCSICGFRNIYPNYIGD